MDETAAEAAKFVSNGYGLFAYFISAIGLPLVALLSKHWINKSEQLEAEKTKNRALKRDEKINQIKTELTNEIESVKKEFSGLGKSFDEHKNKESLLVNQFAEFDKRLQKIEKNLIERKEFEDLKTTVHGIDKTMTKIATILEERLRIA
jgi:septal ring factor EnvC (AmiA/AmiB activator)